MREYVFILLKEGVLFIALRTLSFPSHISCGTKKYRLNGYRWEIQAFSLACIHSMFTVPLKKLLVSWKMKNKVKQNIKQNKD